jgi:hypothetical protein
MTRHEIRIVRSVLTGLLLSLGGLAAAQQEVPVGTALEPLPSVDGTATDPTVPAEATQPEGATPASPTSEPAPPPAWTYEQTQSNTAGTVTNTHRYVADEQGVPYLREHAVVTPRREMVQTWEHTQTEEGGYLDRRSHTFTAPDGTMLRQHSWSRSGTDPYNYTRQHEMTFRDGRTMTHTQTRTWDGTTGTMDRTFVGPNGQTRQMTRPWTPDDVVAGTAAPAAEPAPADTAPTSTDAAPTSTAPAPAGTTGEGPSAEGKSRWGWLKKLNPFGGGVTPRGPNAGSAPRRSGFTVGSGRGSRPQVPPGLSSRQPGEPNPHSHRPAWAGPPAGQGGGPPASHSAPGRSRSR